MDHALVNCIRISLMLSLVCLTIQAVPELSHAASRPFLVLWMKLRRFQTILSDHAREEKRSFWEIDMTDFEP